MNKLWRAITQVVTNPDYTGLLTPYFALVLHDVHVVRTTGGNIGPTKIYSGYWEVRFGVNGTGILFLHDEPDPLHDKKKTLIPTKAAKRAILVALAAACAPSPKDAADVIVRLINPMFDQEFGRGINKEEIDFTKLQIMEER